MPQGFLQLDSIRLPSVGSLSHSLLSQQPPLEATHVLVMICSELKPGLTPGRRSCFCQRLSPLPQRGGWLQVHASGSGEGVRQGKTSRGPLLPTHDHYPNTLSLKARQTTAFWWPLYSLLISPVSTHQSLARLSEEAGTEHEKRSGIYCNTL